MLTAPERQKIRRYRSKLSLFLGDKSGACAHLLREQCWRYTVSRAEKTVLRRHKKISATEWAPLHFKVPYGPYEGRPFSFDVTPHLWGMLEAYVLPFVQKITVQAAAQTTKTTFAHVATTWSSKFEPGTQAYLLPNENDADEMMEDRIQKAYELSAQLRKLLTGRKEDKSKKKLRLRNCIIRMLWAGSLSRLASRSFKVGVADETNKFQETPSESEGTTLDLFKLRFRTFMQKGMRGAKLLILSSPSIDTGFVTVELEKETEAVFVFWSRCPYCDTEQLMEFGPDTFTWPKGEDGHSLDRKVIKSKYLARYICTESSCKKHWDDDIRLIAQQLNMKGGWRLRTEDGSQGEEMLRYLRRERPQSIGFIVPSWISKFVSLSEVAHDYLKSKDKNLSPEERFNAAKHFKNAHESLPWRVELAAKPVEKIKEFIDDRPEGRPPGGGRVATLLGHVDTQDDCFYLSIWAIGWGFHNEMWLVLRKQVFSKEEIITYLWNSEYIDGDGQEHIVEHAGIDFLGHRSKEIIEFCLQYEGLLTPTYGSSRPMGSMSYAWSQREYIPGTKTAIPGGGIQAMRINTKYHKDAMAAKLGAEKDSPGCIHLYETVGDDYCKQLTSEAPDQNGDWQQIGSRANHYWDNLVAVSALADWRGIKLRPKPDPDESEEEDEVIKAQSDFMGG
mgnify:CR=1 FL=1